jgi:hypothetical protein
VNKFPKYAYQSLEIETNYNKIVESTGDLMCGPSQRCPPIIDRQKICTNLAMDLRHHLATQILIMFVVCLIIALITDHVWMNISMVIIVIHNDTYLSTIIHFNPHFLI